MLANILRLCVAYYWGWVELKVDILIVGDFRFPGGTSTSIISEIRALHSAGYQVGLLGIACGLFANTRDMHQGIRAEVAAGRAAFVPPGTAVSARLCCLHHPVVFESLPAIPLEIDCPDFLLIVHHPPVDADGEPQYDLPRIRRVTEELFGRVEWAPVGPKVREAFGAVPSPPPLTVQDWSNILNVETYRRDGKRLPAAAPVVGRHSRPEAIKWPEDEVSFLGAYPDAPDVRVRLMGWSDALDDIVPQRPANWDVMPFGTLSPSDFLATLDYFSYFHSEQWVEAFGRSIQEAMAAGLVCFLPEHFRPLFEDAAVYCGPEEVLGHIRRFEGDRAAYDAQSKRARDFIQQRFGPRIAVDRVRARIGAPAPPMVEPKAAPPASVFYLTTNGIGMGHITRCLATARRLSSNCKPTILTMSKSFDVARQQGFDVEYVPFLRSIGLDYLQWSEKVRAEFEMIFRYHKPDVFVFDGNVPYEPLMDVLPQFPQMWKLWQRRPLWPPDVGQEYLGHAGSFDVVLEPGELAAPVDRGLTVKERGAVLEVPSIRFLDSEEALDRRAARKLIGLDPGRPALLMQLGSGNNFDLAAAIEMILAEAQSARSDPQIVFARWRISTNSFALPEQVKVLDAYPISRYLNAFDCAVAMAGYNSFHENIAAGLPTLFTANEHPEQDEQWLRADYAALKGMALSARADDTPQFRRALRRLFERETQNRLRAACLRQAMPNGATAAAEFIEGLAMSRKTSDLPFDPNVTAMAWAGE